MEFQRDTKCFHQDGFSMKRPFVEIHFEANSGLDIRWRKIEFVYTSAMPPSTKYALYSFAVGTQVSRTMGEQAQSRIANDLLMLTKRHEFTRKVIYIDNLLKQRRLDHIS